MSISACYSIRVSFRSYPMYFSTADDLLVRFRTVECVLVGVYFRLGVYKGVLEGLLEF